MALFICVLKGESFIKSKIILSIIFLLLIIYSIIIKAKEDLIITLKQENSYLHEQINILTEEKKTIEKDLFFYEEKVKEDKLKYEQIINNLHIRITELEEIDENMIIFDKRINFEVLNVLLRYFEGISENNKEKIRNSLPLGTSEDDYLFKWAISKSGKNIVLTEIRYKFQDNIGRPRYVIDVKWKDTSRMFVLHKMENGWKIVDID